MFLIAAPLVPSPFCDVRFNKQPKSMSVVPYSSGIEAEIGMLLREASAAIARPSELLTHLMAPDANHARCLLQRNELLSSAIIGISVTELTMTCQLIQMMSRILGQGRGQRYDILLALRMEYKKYR